MRKYLFSILLILSVGIALPGIWMKLLPEESVSEEPESLPEESVTVPEETIPKEPSSEEPTPDETVPEEPTPVPEEPLPPVDNTYKNFTTVDRTYWDDALFIGDSRTVGLSEYADLGNADVFAYSGMSVYTVFDKELSVNGSEKQNLETLLTNRQYGKIYIMMGINELGYYFNPTVEKYRNMIAHIQELQPGALIFLEANLHVTQTKSDSDEIYNNAGINRMNQAIAEMADNISRFYVDVNELFDDAQGNLDTSYTADDAHVLGKHYATWADWLLTKGI